MKIDISLVDRALNSGRTPEQRCTIIGNRTVQKRSTQLVQKIIALTNKKLTLDRPQYIKNLNE